MRPATRRSGRSRRGPPPGRPALPGSPRARQGDRDGAIADFTQAIARDPGEAWVYAQRGYAREDLGDLAGAIADFAEAIRLEFDPQYHLARGLALVRQGNDAQAQKDFDVYLKSRPDAVLELAEQIRIAKEKRAK